MDDKGFPIAYLLDAWECLDETEKHKLYIYAKLNDRYTEWIAFATAFLVIGSVLAIGKGGDAAIIAIIPLTISAGLVIFGDLK